MSRTQAVADLLRAAAGGWVDGRRLAEVGGLYAWRTRVSDCRRSPFSLVIVNRQRTITQPDGTAFTVSEYRLVAPTAPPAWELVP